MNVTLLNSGELHRHGGRVDLANVHQVLHVGVWSFDTSTQPDRSSAAMAASVYAVNRSGVLLPALTLTGVGAAVGAAATGPPVMAVSASTNSMIATTTADTA